VQRNVVCLKWGTLYGAEYVNKLYGMVQRNVSDPVRFVCFTEDASGIRPEVEVAPLPVFPEPEWKYARYCSAWRKLALFDSTALGLSGKTLFLDLDVVILRSLEPFFSASNTFAMLENWYQPGKGQASVMMFQGDIMKPVLERYLNNSIAVLDQFQTEQEYISHSVAEGATFFPASLCLSYKKHVMRQGLNRFCSSAYTEPSDAHIIVFHGRPNPPDAIKGEWGKPMPAPKRWWKALKPCPWIEDYWRE